MKVNDKTAKKQRIFRIHSPVVKVYQAQWNSYKFRDVRELLQGVHGRVTGELWGVTIITSIVRKVTERFYLVNSQTEREWVVK